MAQGIGYDMYPSLPRKQYISPNLHMVMRSFPNPSALHQAITLPKPPPRFPTPGQMDGARNYQSKWHGNMMAAPVMYGGR